MSEIVQSIIERNAYMTLATADEHGTPWASPVWYATTDSREFVWVSTPSARHSRENRPYTSEAVYISARSEQVPDRMTD
jgi:nitroimidazol reductase NimA-like FMN-containing flavoprotein (pyridoxamine 5'-phosphate oxidase superfamily)